MIGLSFDGLVTVFFLHSLEMACRAKDKAGAAPLGLGIHSNLPRPSGLGYAQYRSLKALRTFLINKVFRDTEHKPLCRPAGALPLSLTLPTAYAVGSIISPFQGWAVAALNLS
jgi:hypothetical protein